MCSVHAYHHTRCALARCNDKIRKQIFSLWSIADALHEHSTRVGFIMGPIARYPQKHAKLKHDSKIRHGSKQI